MAEKNMQIGQILLQDSLITESQLIEALSLQKQTGQKVGDILIKKGYVSELDFTRALAKRLKTDYVNLANLKLNPAVVHSIKEDFARSNCLIALERRGKTLIVAMSDPMNFYVIEDMHFMTGMDIRPVISTPSAIYRAIDEYYLGRVASEAAKDVNKEFTSGFESDLANLETEMDERVDSAPVVRLVNSIILQAAKLGASDIHVEPNREDTKVRMRVDGHLRDVLKLSKNAHASVVTRLKIMSSMNIAERRVPQDGRCEAEIEGEMIDMRLSTIPTVYGEKVVIRLLPGSSSNKLATKQALGFSPNNMRLFDKLIRISHGVLLVTGPTGSGKTTTLYTIINEIKSPEINIVTIEDPVEYKIDGANQMQINEKAGLTFAGGLRSILRQDPDVIMIGEIRDGETASIAIRAAITGHIVLSTLHTNDAATSVNRLVDMGVKPYLVSSAVSGVIAQRLVRKICPDCKKPYTSSESENNILGLNHSATLYKGEGCANCSFTGYKGRTAIHEIIIIDNNIRNMITKEESSEAIMEYALKNGTVTLRQDMVARVLAGDSTVEELLTATFTL
jgi:type IV pilus assembly protein PilB